MSKTPAIRREILFQITDIARAMRTYIDQRAREHGMTRAQWGALLRLERQEGMTQAEMAESLETQPISVARLIDRLCTQELVERRPHPSDRRANCLYLTPKGRATLASFVPLGREISASVLASLDEVESGQLLDVLMRIKNNLRQANAINGPPTSGARRPASGMRHAG
jgi:DNA-binding MarR family transcriptional regulator